MVNTPRRGTQSPVYHVRCRKEIFLAKSYANSGAICTTRSVKKMFDVLGRAKSGHFSQETLEKLREI